MVQGKTLATEVQMLREELAALKSEWNKSEAPENGEELAAPQSKLQDDLADRASAIEQAVKEFAKTGEKELANRPFATAGIAFLLGFLAGRASKR